MTWTTAIEDLRAQLSDGPTDKIIWRKKVVGKPNGTLKTFKTFEFQRVSPFVGSVDPVGVFVDDIRTTVTAEDLVSGQFEISAAPSEGATVEATYYIQWFLDAKLISFLGSAANFIAGGMAYTDIPSGLIPSALKYAAADAYQELAVRFARMLSEQYRMEDLPHESLKATIDSYSKMASQYRKEAVELRNDFYTRKGEAGEPNFVTIEGTVRDVKPNR